jgi:hypothetical protein
MTVEHFQDGVGYPQLDLFANQGVRHRVIVALELDVIIEPRHACPSARNRGLDLFGFLKCIVNESRIGATFKDIASLAGHKMELVRFASVNFFLVKTHRSHEAADLFRRACRRQRFHVSMVTKLGCFKPFRYRA